jgi:hypothetical protein
VASPSSLSGHGCGKMRKTRRPVSFTAQPSGAGAGFIDFDQRDTSTSPIDQLLFISF